VNSIKLKVDAVFWNVKPYSLVDKQQHFEGTCWLHLQSKRLFYPEYGGNTFLRSVCTNTKGHGVTSEKITVIFIVTAARTWSLATDDNVSQGIRQFLCSRYSDWLRDARPRGRSFSLGRVKNFLFSTSSRPALGSTKPPIQSVPGELSPGVLRPEREANHLPQISAEVKKIWIYTSTSIYAIMT
jgi:hypothetical protein